MKIINTNNQLEIKQSGMMQVIIGFVVIVVGVGLLIFSITSGKPGQPFPIAPLAIGAVAVIIGGLIVGFAKNRHFILRLGGDTTVESKRIIGGSQTAQSFPTTTIVGVRLYTTASQTTDSTFNNSSNTPLSVSNNRKSVLSLLLSNNDVVEIGSASGTSGGIGAVISHAPLSKEANEIANFLGLPLDAQDSSSLIGAVNTIKDTVQAIQKLPTTSSVASPIVTLQPTAPPPLNTSPLGEPVSPASQPPSDNPPPPQSSLPQPPLQ